MDCTDRKWALSFSNLRQPSPVQRYSDMVDASEYLEQDPMPAISSDNEDDAEDTEESSPILLSSKLLNYASTHIRRPSGSLDRPKAITSMDELFKPVNYDVLPLKQAPLPPALPPTIFADKELALGQGRNHTGKIYGKQRNFPVKPHMTTNIAAPASRIRLHERVNARYSNGVTVLGGNHSHSISGIRQSYNSVVTDDITGAALSSSLSRTPSLSASSSRSCESLVSSASSSSSLSSSSSIPVTRRLSSNRSAGSLPSYRNSAILTDSSASSSTTSRIARKSSTSRIPTMASIGASPVTVATSMDEEKKTEEIIHSCAVAPVLNRRYSSADAYTSTMTSPPIRPSMSHRRHQSNQSISEKLILEEEEEDDSTNQLLTSIRARHDRLTNMLENIRHRMAQVKKSWEEDESGRQLYIARLRSSAIMERPVSLPVNMTLFDKSSNTSSSGPASPRTPTTPPTLPVKSARRQLQARDSREMMTANTTNVLPPIVETPRFIAPPSSSPSRFNTGADVNAAMIKKRSLENRRSGLPTLSSRPRSRLFTASTTVSSSSASPITMMADPLPRTYARLS